MMRWFPDFSYEWMQTIKYVALYLAVPIFMYYLHHLYPEETSPVVCRIAGAAGGLFTVLALLTPARVYTKTLQLYELFTVAMIVYLLYALLKACRRRREAAWIIVAATAFFFTTVINDFLHYNGTIRTGEYTTFGLFVYTFAQAFLLSLRFASAFSSLENMARNWARPTRNCTASTPIWKHRARKNPAAGRKQRTVATGLQRFAPHGGLTPADDGQPFP